MCVCVCARVRACLAILHRHFSHFPTLIPFKGNILSLYIMYMRLCACVSTHLHIYSFFEIGGERRAGRG